MIKKNTFNIYLIMLFLNSFVDLGHKIIVQNTVFKIHDGPMQITLIAIVNGLILLPYVMLFTPAAYFSNRFPLLKVMRLSAWFAWVCSGFITYFYYIGAYQQAFMMTLMLAIQSALYSPAKYGYIKQLMGEAKLVSANAKVQVTTIIAILAGTLVFSILFESLLANQLLNTGALSESAILKTIAPLGWLLIISTSLEVLMAYKLPVLGDMEQKIKPFSWPNYLTGRSFRKEISVIISNRKISYAIGGLSVFWGLSQMALAAFPAYAKQDLMMSNTAVVQAILACSGLGIFLGGIFISKLSKRTQGRPIAEHELRMQMIPFGALGIAISFSLLMFVSTKVSIALCFFGVGFFGAYFIVPLNAIIQSQTSAGQTGTILAGNNWLQNVSMLSFLGITILSAMNGMGAKWLFYLMGIIASVSAALYLYKNMRYFWHFTLGGLFRLRYKIDRQAAEAIPKEGAVLLLGNHISWIDWALVQLVIERPIRFVIDKSFYDNWFLHPILRCLGAIPISPKRSKEAINTINKILQAGDVVCLFPEGKISHSGALSEFKAGYKLAMKNTDATIMPFYIKGMHGSRLARQDEPRSGRFDWLIGKKRHITILLGESMKEVSVADLQSKVAGLRDADDKGA